MKQNQPFGKSTFLCKDEIFISCHHKSFISKLFRDKEEEKSLEIKKLKCEKITKSNFRLFWGRGRGWPHGTVDGLHASQPAATGSILSNPEIFKKMSFRTQRFENGRCQLGSPKKTPLRSFTENASIGLTLCHALEENALTMFLRKM